MSHALRKDTIALTPMDRQEKPGKGLTMCLKNLQIKAKHNSWSYTAVYSLLISMAPIS